MPITLDVITGLAGSGRRDFAKAIQVTQQNTHILVSAENFLPNAQSARQRTQIFFSAYALPELVRGDNVIFVTDLCDDLCPAQGIIENLTASIREQCPSPVVMNVIHIQPPEPTACIHELLGRNEQITGDRTQVIQRGFHLFRSHGPCYPDHETLVLPPLSSTDVAIRDAVDMVMIAKGRRIELRPDPSGQWIKAVTEHPIGEKIAPTRKKQQSIPANPMPQPQHATLHC